MPCTCLVVPAAHSPGTARAELMTLHRTAQS